MRERLTGFLNKVNAGELICMDLNKILYYSIGNYYWRWKKVDRKMVKGVDYKKLWTKYSFQDG